MESLEVVAAYFQVRAVFLVLVADGLQHVAVRQQNLSGLHGKRLRVHRGIVDRDGHVQVAEITAVKTLLDAQRFAVRMPRHVEPGAIVESRRVDDKRVAFPSAD